MGGAGSGAWYRWNSRTTLDDVTRLDVRWLQRQGYVPRGPQAVSTTATESIMMVDNSLVLNNRYGIWGRRDWQPECQVIELAWTPCHYGGQRPWFVCSLCQRRIAVLWLRATRFVCRHCVKLPYGSRQETPQDRRYRKVRKMRKRLGASGSLMESIRPWNKPKGMHWCTWERLREQEERVQWQILRDLEAFLVRFGAPPLAPDAFHDHG